MFEKLKTQLLVLRHIAFFRPHAHLAFLFYAPYRAMYDNEGQNVELCEEHYGQWIYVAEDKKQTWFEKVYLLMKHNDSCAYHPRYAIIAFDYSLNEIMLRKSGIIKQYFINGVKNLVFNSSMDELHRVKNEKEIEFYKQKIQEYRAKAVMTWKGDNMR